MDSLAQELQNLGITEDGFLVVRNEDVDENRNPQAPVNLAPVRHPQMFRIGTPENNQLENHRDEKDKEEAESEEEGSGEPSHVCLICSAIVPISTSLVHKRDCYYHDDNQTCPFCYRRRRYQLMEEHIERCAPNYTRNSAQINRTIFLYRCSQDVVELSLRKLRDSLEERYKYSLHTNGENPLSTCMMCKNSKQHSEGLCLHTMIGDDFQWRAEQLVAREVYPQYNNYLELTKRNILLQTEKRYYNRAIDARLEPLNVILDRRSRSADQKMQRLRNEKKEEVNQIIKRHKRTLGNRVTWYRDYYIVNILYPSMGIHISP